MNLMDKYYKIFFNFIHENSLIQKNDKIVIAVSGGYDSVALALLLNSVKKELDIKLLIAHLNHKIRGRFAEDDERFVENFAEGLNISFISDEVNIPLLKKKNKKDSLEEISRVERYKFLKNICKTEKFNKIATGHHINDSIENFFLTVLIGGGLKGLAGVPVKTGNVIRPLLCFTKDDLIDIVKIAGYKPRIDITNFDTNIPRNWIRHRLLSFIREEFKPFEKQLINLMDIIKYENEFIESEIDIILKDINFKYGVSIPINAISDKPKALLRRVVYAILKKLKYKEINYNLINLIVASLDLKSNRINDLVIWRYNKRLYLTKHSSIKKYNYSIESEQEIEINEINYSVKRKLIHKKVDKYKKSCIYIDNKNIERIVIRSRKKGDKIKLMNTNYLKSLKELFIDLKIPKILRDIIPVIEINGKIAGIYFNLAPVCLTNKISNDYKIVNETKEAIILDFKEVI